jgi:hypothetical protein
VDRPHRLVFTSFGARIGVQTDHADLLEAARTHLPPGARESEGAADTWYTLADAEEGGEAVLRVGRRALARASDGRQLLGDLESALHVRVSRHARRCLFVHAGVVAVHGRAVLIPGRSMSGKTTLVDALVRAGATYFSDEYAVLDAWGSVHPYAKPLSIRVAGAPTPRRVSPPSSASDADRGPAPAALVVVTQYRAEAAWNPCPLSPGDVLLALLSNTVRMRRRPAFALRVLAAAVRGVPGLAGDRGSAQATAHAIIAHVESTLTERVA